MKIVISVVLYKTPIKTVKQLLENFCNITRTTYHEMHLILVDNHSQDKALSDFLSNCSSGTVETISLSHNLGFGAGHNAAFESIQSDAFLVMNPDISHVTKDGIDSAVDLLFSHEEIGLVVPKLYNPDGSVQHTNKRQSTIFDQAIRLIGQNAFKQRQSHFMRLDDGYESVNRTMNAHGAMMLFKSKVFKEIGGFDERFFLYMEDTDITMEINQHHLALYDPSFTAVHEWQQNNRNLKGIRYMLQSMAKYYHKWGWKFL